MVAARRLQSQFASDMPEEYPCQNRLPGNARVRLQEKMLERAGGNATTCGRKCHSVQEEMPQRAGGNATVCRRKCHSAKEKCHSVRSFTLLARKSRSGQTFCPSGWFPLRACRCRNRQSQQAPAAKHRHLIPGWLNTSMAATAAEESLAAVADSVVRLPVRLPARRQGHCGAAASPASWCRTLSSGHRSERL